MQISDTVWRLFGLLGMVTFVACIVLMAYALFVEIREVVQKWRWNYKYKHRFRKQPTAACYCKDCRWHIDGIDKCNNITWADKYTPENGFCYEAEPKARDDNAFS